MPTALENNDPPPRAEAIVTYYVDRMALQRRHRRIIVSCGPSAPPTIDYVDQGAEHNVTLESPPGGEATIRVRKGAAGKPTVFAIQVKTGVSKDDGEYLHPIGLLMRRTQTGPLAPNSFTGAWVDYDGSGRASLIVADIESDLGEFKFDLLFRDVGELNYALLDPRLENS